MKRMHEGFASALIAALEYAGVLSGDGKRWAADTCFRQEIPRGGSNLDVIWEGLMRNSLAIAFFMIVVCAGCSGGGGKDNSDPTPTPTATPITSSTPTPTASDSPNPVPTMPPVAMPTPGADSSPRPSPIGTWVLTEGMLEGYDVIGTAIDIRSDGTYLVTVPPLVEDGETVDGMKEFSGVWRPSGDGYEFDQLQAKDDADVNGVYGVEEVFEDEYEADYFFTLNRSETGLTLNDGEHEVKLKSP